MNIIFERGEQQVALNDFITFLNAKAAESAVVEKSHFDPHTYRADVGPKNIKIVEQRYGRAEAASVYCFLDRKGNILKAASWKAPAKGVRGTIFDNNYSWGRGLGPYGAAYLR